MLHLAAVSVSDVVTDVCVCAGGRMAALQYPFPQVGRFVFAVHDQFSSYSFSERWPVHIMLCRICLIKIPLAGPPHSDLSACIACPLKQ